MLERFRAAKANEVHRLEQQYANGHLPRPLPGRRPSLKALLLESDAPGVVAEYKRASPSHGVINPRLGAREAAEAYAAGGATGISILTENQYFQGSLAFLERAASVGLPLLRKDFLFHPLQIEETAATPAAAVLLIVRYFLDAPETLAALVGRAQSHGLETVVEVFAAEEIGLAREAGADIIQVNNRDLETLEVRLERSLELGAHKGPNDVWISASGITDVQTVQALGRSGYDGVLVGTWLMQQPDPAAAVRALYGAGYA